MDFTVQEESDILLKFQLPSETHTFCNALKAELNTVKGVTLATYKIDHPLVGIPTFQLETKGITGRKALLQALKLLGKKAEEFKKAVSAL